MLLFGTTNPTALLGKAEATIDWGLDLVAFSETSHTEVASRVIRTSFRKLGWKALLGHAVRDKFATKTGASSFRGLSKGVALASKWPCYDVVPGKVPLEVWQGGRLHLGCVHAGQLPVHVVTVYLMPNAPPGSFRYEVNCSILSWAVFLCTGLVGPVMLCGDFNSPLGRWPMIRGLLERGWVDVGLLQAEVSGEDPQPTCLGSARHTFQIVNSELVQFWKFTQVRSAPDLDKHDLLVSEFDIPVKIPRVPKWMLPRSFLDGPVDKGVLNSVLLHQQDECEQLVQEALDNQDIASAVAMWSQFQENGFRESACHCDGSKRVLNKKYFGRCQVETPKLVQLALPRCKTGRPGDYRPPYIVAGTNVRQLVKQTRRLQRLWHILSHREGPLLQDAVELWDAIIRATGFGKAFPQWCIGQIGWFPVQFPDSGSVGALYQSVKEFTDDASRRAWALKREAFATELETSCATKGCSLPCRVVKEETQPMVTEMKVSYALQLIPQPWLPHGKAWVKVSNTTDFVVGDSLSWDGITVTIQEIQADTVRLDRLVSRREAANLECSKVEVSPVIWTGRFVKAWDTFWNRDSVDPFDQDMVKYVDMVTQLPSFELETITEEVLYDAVRGLKTTSMRGCDGWSYGELKLLPVGSFRALARVFQAIESGASWPASLTQWFLVLLRKDSSPVPTWDQIRPISVAAGLYRLWARLRAKEVLSILSLRQTGMIKPNLPTPAIWGMLSDYLDWTVGKGSKPAGLVLDIVKAFNCLNRKLLGELLRKIGAPHWLWRGWQNALTHMTRRVQVSGFHFQSSLSSTGIPEGDPLSVAGMWAYSYMFGEVVSGLSGSNASVVCPVTYADNWEVWCTRLRPLVDLLDPLAAFLRTCRLPIAVEKCWGWSTCPKDRKVLRTCSFDDRALPILLSAKCLGADIAYCGRVAAATRNKRVRTGGLRLVRLAGLPLNFYRRASIVRMSVWKQALHGAATSAVPDTVFRKLRSKLCRGLRVDRAGRSPWLVASMLTAEPLDPEFEVLLDRLRLCRQLATSVPEWQSMLPQLWTPIAGKYKGVTRRFILQLEGLGWESCGDGTFQDGHGRRFDVVKTSFVHIRRLLKSSWCDKVVSQCVHRKGLEALESLDNLNLRHWRGLDAAEAGLVRQSIVGAHFTGDAKSHFGGDRLCPLCASQDDSREHRFLCCSGTADLRIKWDIAQALTVLPRTAVTYGLFPELDELRIFQAALDSIQVPGVTRVDSGMHEHLFTDGSCLFPRWADLRISSGAVVRSREGHLPELLWTGLVPGQQGTFRGELLAGAVAAGMFHVLTIYSDCWAFVRRAARMLDRFRRNLRVSLPKAHRDLWDMFWQNVTAPRVEVYVVWTPAHRQVLKLTGNERWKALHNDCADKFARKTCTDFVDKCPSFRKLVADFHVREKHARGILKYHAQVAYRFVAPRDRPRVEVSEGPVVCLDEPSGTLPLVPVDFSEAFCPRYLGLLHSFFSEATWAPSSGQGRLVDTSFVELFVLCTRACGLLPPIRWGNEWRLVDEDQAFAACDLDCLRLFRTWRKAFSVWHGTVGCPFELVSKASSLSLLGVSIVCAGVAGRFLHPLSSSYEVGRVCGSATSLGGMAVPFLV